MCASKRKSSQNNSVLFLSHSGEGYGEADGMGIERLGTDAAAVGPDDCLRHRKAHSRAARLRVAAGVCTIEAIEQALQIALRHRIYRVTHLQGHPAARAS